MGGDFFTYRDGVMHAEDRPLPEIAAAVGTPFYCYSSGALDSAYRSFAGALEGLNATICYALKANSNRSVISTLASPCSRTKAMFLASKRMLRAFSTAPSMGTP